MLPFCVPAVVLALGILAISGWASAGPGLRRRAEAEAEAKQGDWEPVGNRCWGQAVLLSWQCWQAALAGMCTHMCVTALSVGPLSSE